MDSPDLVVPKSQAIIAAGSFCDASCVPAGFDDPGAAGRLLFSLPPPLAEDESRSTLALDCALVCFLCPISGVNQGQFDCCGFDTGRYRQ